MWKRPGGRPTHYYWRLVCLCSLVLLGSCQADSPDTRFQNYLGRLATTLSVTAVTPEYPTTLRPPRSGKLRLEIPSDSLDTLDFLALSGCAVQVTIGKRNSSLGRMAKPSQRLLLALEYLRLAPDCITYLRNNGKSPLAELLQQSWQLKREQLPALIFNATLGGDEYRSLWLASPVIADFPKVSSSVSVSALKAVNEQVSSWLSGDYRADNRSFELLLGEVAGGDAGILLKALSRQSAWLDSADRMLQQRMARGPLCGPGTRFEATDILPGVVRKYFIGEIQPQAARMIQQYHHLLTPLTHLEGSLTENLPADYRQWTIDRSEHFDKVASAAHRHMEQLKTLQEPCTLHPKA